MVDGAPVASSVLTLSHWPGTPTPEPLRRDLSAGIVFAWLRGGGRSGRWPRRPGHRPEVVTTDHFDQDGLVGVFTVTEPERALSMESQLMAVAEAGDFARGTSRDALRASFALASLAESCRGGPGTNAALEGELHREALRLLPELLADPEPWRELWAEEGEFLDDTTAALAAGRARITEHEAADLAVVSAPHRDLRPASQLGRLRPALVHPVPIHNSTTCSRVLVSAPPYYELYFRYETWVRIVSARWRPRCDLTRAASELTELEPGSAVWTFNGTGATIARLNPADGAASDLPPDQVEKAVLRALSSSGSSGA